MLGFSKKLKRGKIKKDRRPETGNLRQKAREGMNGLMPIGGTHGAKRIRRGGRSRMSAAEATITTVMNMHTGLGREPAGIELSSKNGRSGS